MTKSAGVIAFVRLNPEINFKLAALGDAIGKGGDQSVVYNFALSLAYAMVVDADVKAKVNSMIEQAKVDAEGTTVPRAKKWLTDERRAEIDKLPVGGILYVNDIEPESANKMIGSIRNYLAKKGWVSRRKSFGVKDAPIFLLQYVPATKQGVLSRLT